MDEQDIAVALDALEDSDDPEVRAWALSVLELIDGRAPYVKPQAPPPRFGESLVAVAIGAVRFFLDGLAVRDVQ